MKNMTKKLMAAFLAMIMVVSFVTVTPVKAAAGTVTFVVEKLTIGQGLLISPTQIQIENGDTVQTVFNKVIELNSGSFTILGGNYLQSIDNADTGVVNIPQEIVLMPNIITSGTYIVDGEEHTYETAYYTPTNASNTGNALKPKLGEGAYHEMSGWMFTINNKSAETSFDQIKVKDGDVIRLQFSLYGWGADLGFDTEAYTGIPKLELQNKDELIKAVGAVNAQKAYWLAYPNVNDAYSKAVAVLSKYNPSASDISGAITTLQAAQKAPTYPAVGKTSISQIKNVKGRKAKITAKVLTGATGYQFMYGTKKNFKKAKTLTTVKNVMTTKKFKKVVNKKTKKVKATTCYAKVRAYKKVNGVRVFGEWSAIKSVKIKK